MITNGTLVVILLALGALGAGLWFPQNRRMNFLTATTVVFVVYVLPKIGLLSLNVTSVLLPSAAAFSPAAINAAALLIAGFVAAVAAAYVAAAVFVRERPAAVPVARHDPAVLRATVAAAIMPVFLMLFGFYVAVAGVSGESLFAKRELIVDGGITPVYVLQKAAQIAKCGFYLMMIPLFSGLAPRRGDLGWFAVFFVATSLVYAVSGQRSGILLLTVEALLALQIAGRLRGRTVLALVAFFVAVSVAILWTRMRDVGDLALVNAVFRRYFFDIEKIAGLIEYAVSDPVWRFSPAAIFLTAADAELPSYSLHHFIGDRVFGTLSGVPPSLAGEIILYAGPVFLLPATFAVALGIARAERLGRRLREPALRVALVSVLAKVYYFTLNSDLGGLVRRSAFDLLLLLLALGIYRVFHEALRAQLRRA